MLYSIEKYSNSWCCDTTQKRLQDATSRRCVCVRERERERCVCEVGRMARQVRSSASMFHLEGPDGFFGLLDCEVAPRGHGGAVEQLRVQHLPRDRGRDRESRGEGERAEGCPNGW
jgi:hypothetical protein